MEKDVRSHNFEKNGKNKNSYDDKFSESWLANQKIKVNGFSGKALCSFFHSVSILILSNFKNFFTDKFFNADFFPRLNAGTIFGEAMIGEKKILKKDQNYLFNQNFRYLTRGSHE